MAEPKRAGGKRPDYPARARMRKDPGSFTKSRAPAGNLPAGAKVTSTRSRGGYEITRYKTKDGKTGSYARRMGGGRLAGRGAPGAKRGGQG